MPLETKVVHIPLVAGMMQKADEKALTPPGMEAVLNKQFTKQGALDTRPAWTTATTNGYNGETNTRPRSLIGAAHEIVTVDDAHRAFAYDRQGAKWSLRGIMPTWQVTTKALLRSSTESLEAPQLLSTGGSMWAFYQRDSVWRLLRVDPETGTALGTEITATPAGIVAGDARIAQNGVNFCVLYTDVTNVELRWAYIPVASPAQPTTHGSISAYTHTPVFDVCAIGADFAFGYSVTGGDLYILRVNAAYGIVDVSPTITYFDPLQVSLASTSTDAYLGAISSSVATGIHEKASLFHYVWNSGGAAYTGSVIYDFTGDDQLTGGIAISMYTGSTVLVLCTKSPWTWDGFAYDLSGKTWGTYCAVFAWDSGTAKFVAAANSSASRWTAQVTTDTRPFEFESRWYAWFRCDADALGNSALGNATGYALLDLTPQISISAAVGGVQAPVVSWAEPRALPPQPVSYAALTHPLIGRNFSIDSDGNGKMWSCCAVVTGGSSSILNVAPGYIPYRTSLAAYGADIVLIDTTRPFSATAASVESLSLVNGATPWVYGGTSQQPDAYTLLGGPAEWGFFTRPDGMTATAGGSTLTGTCRYAAIYEWIDDTGHKVRSEPAYYPPSGSATTLTLKDNMSIVIPYLKLTNRQGLLADSRPVALVLYRADSAGDGIFHRVTPTPTTSAYANNIDPAAESYTATDTGHVGAHQANEILYTEGGVSEDQIPPPFSCIVSHKGRFFGAAGARLWFTKQYSFDAIPGFNSLNIISVADGDSITGLASLDSALVVFKHSGIYIINGDGPSDAGAGNDYVPSKVATPLGCIEPRSIATTSEGIVFQAAEGLFMLNRSMQVEYIGAGIEDELARWPVVTSATYVPAQYQVRFSCGIGFNTGGSPSIEGVTLVYDLTFKTWARWQSESGAQGVVATADGLPARLEPLWSSSTADVLFEAGATTDDGAGVPSGFTTAWIKMNEMQGYQRVRRVTLLGNPTSQTALEVQIRTDYGKTSDTFSWSAWELAQTQTAAGVQLEIHVPHQKCESLQIEVLEASDTSPWPPTQTFDLLDPADIANFAPGDSVCFLYAVGSGSDYAYDSVSGAAVGVVGSVSATTVTLTTDPSAWSSPPGASWYVVPAAWLALHQSALTHTTTASAAGVQLGQASTPASPGRGIVWQSIALEVATMDMRYKGLAPAART